MEAAPNTPFVPSPTAPATTDDRTMASTTTLPTPAESPDILNVSTPLRGTNDKNDGPANSRSGSANTDAEPAAPAVMSPKEAKKWRLRELRESYDYVRTIINYMAKHYTEVAPPSWLDLRAVAAQLGRSIQRGTNHKAYLGLKNSLKKIEVWMGNHRTWEEAVKVAAMPYIATRSEIFAVEFLDITNAKPLLSQLRGANLDFLMDPEPRASEDVPVFWRGAGLDDHQWRYINMERPTLVRPLPFNDDITDLVLSTVCNSSKAKGGNDQSLPGEGKPKTDKADNVDAMDGPSEDSIETDKPIKKEEDAEMRNGAVSAGNPVLVGKRPRDEDGKTEAHNKRRKTVEDLSDPDKPIGTIENTEDDGTPISYTAKMSMTKDSDNHASLTSNNNKVKKEAEQTAGRRQDPRKDSSTSKENRKPPNGKIARLRDQLKGVEAESKRLAAQCTALETEIKKLEGQCAQIATLEDENKCLKTQIAAVVARVEALEARATQHVDADTDGTSAPGNTEKATGSADRARLGSVGTQQSLPKSEGPERASDVLIGFEQQEDERAVSAQPPNSERALSRFPRVLELPTFDSTDHTYSKQSRCSHGIVPGYSFPASLTSSSSALAPRHAPFGARYRSPTSGPNPPQAFVKPLPSFCPVHSAGRTSTAAAAATRPNLAIADSIEHPAIRAHLPWLPAGYSGTIVSFGAAGSTHLDYGRTCSGHCDAL